MAYNESTYKAATKLYVNGGMTLEEISEMNGMPSINTLSKHKQRGTGNDGVDWAETRASIQKAERAVARKAQLDKTKADLDNLVGEAIIQLRNQLENEGASNPSYKQLIDLYDKLMEYEGRDHLQIVFEIMYDIVEDVGEVLAYHIHDPNKVRVILADLQERMTEYEKRLDPVIEGA
jgi:D-mannonate dehydratase